MTCISGVNFLFKMTNSHLKELSNKDTEKIIYNDRNNIFVDAGHNMMDKTIQEKIVSEITLIINEIKDIMKIINSLEKRGILLKGTTTKINSQEGGFLKFLQQLVTAGLPLMKNELTPLGKSVLIPLRLTAAISAKNAAIQVKIYQSVTTILIISSK